MDDCRTGKLLYALDYCDKFNLNIKFLSGLVIISDHITCKFDISGNTFLETVNKVINYIKKENLEQSMIIKTKTDVKL